MKCDRKMMGIYRREWERLMVKRVLYVWPMGLFIRWILHLFCWNMERDKQEEAYTCFAVEKCV